MIRIGVDVGGTHTDAVVLDGDLLLAATKQPTSADIETGALSALREAFAQSGMRADAVAMVTIGTTQFTNAVVERRALTPVAALRIGAQSSAAMPVAAKWPSDIRAAALLSAAMIDGGAEYNGDPITPMEAGALDPVIDAMAAQDARAVAITSVFATSNPQDEQAAAAIIAERLPHARISCSHLIGQLGLHQRENATILNAALLELAAHVVTAFQGAFSAMNLSCPLFLSQNDGTVMEAGLAQRFPVFTFSSGPTNSMRGAAFLSGRTDAMVVDIGGTTSDIGMLIEGYPRPSGVNVSIGGVRTNFRMPDVLAVGLGGGSRVSEDGVQIGPQSVGHNLRQEALVFGGDTLTATDIAVAAGAGDIGDKARALSTPEPVRARALAEMRRLLEVNIDRMKTQPDPLPLIVVGGGAFLAPDQLAGVSEVVRPENAGVANAIGAAFAQIGGEAELFYLASQRSRADALDEAKRNAREAAIAAGAIAADVRIAQIDETPMTYMTEPGAVIRVKAVGDVDLARFAPRGGPGGRA